MKVRYRAILFTLCSVLILNGRSVLAQAPYDTVSIYDLQYVPDPEINDQSAYLGDTIVVSGLVMHGPRDLWVGARWAVHIIDPNEFPNPWSGLFIIQHDTFAVQTGFQNVQAGDLVYFTGVVDEFLEFTQVFLLTNPAVPVSIMSSGNPLPDPVSITAADLSTKAVGEKWESMWVKIENATVVNYAITGNWASITDSTGGTTYLAEYFHWFYDRLPTQYQWPPNGTDLTAAGFVRDESGSPGQVYTVNPRDIFDIEIIWNPPPTTIWYEDWEGGVGSWFASNGVWEVGMPTVGPFNVHSGQNCAGTVLGGFYPSNANTRLISPSITLPSIQPDEEIRLYFWQWFRINETGGSGNDVGHVEISISNGPWQMISGPIAGLSPYWTRTGVDLSAYAGSTVRIAFYFSSDGSVEDAGWYVDDISIQHGVFIFANPEDFEQGIGNWYSDNGLWEWGTPTVGPGGAHSGQYVMGTVLNGDYQPNANTRLISPSITLNVISGQIPLLCFWHWFRINETGGAGDDVGYVEISPSNGPWQTISGPIAGVGSVWTQLCSDLSAYADSTVRIAFYFYSGGSAEDNGWYIDDVRIEGILGPTNTIALSISPMEAYPGDTVSVPVTVQLPIDSTYSSAEINFGGFQGQLEFLGLDTTASLIGSAGWAYQVNNTDTLLITAAAGANNISGSGVLFSLRFVVPDTAPGGFIPITLESALFNTSVVPATMINGGVNVLPSFTVTLGDVDLNGLIQAFDASMILKYLANLITLTPQQLANANVTTDTTVSALDASVILMYVVGLVDSFPLDTVVMASGALAMQDQAVQPGELAEIPVQLNNASGILGLQGSFFYDPALLDFQSIQWSPLVAGLMKVSGSDSSRGLIHFAGAGTEAQNNSGLFATLRFRVKQIVFDSTAVTLRSLRWNEGPVQQPAVQATLYMSPTGIGALSQIPEKFELQQNYPNPFNPSTTIRFALPQAASVSLTIYDLTGRRVATLIDQHTPAGWHEVTWDGTADKGHSVSSGVYLLRLEAAESKFESVKKIILLK